MHMLSLIYIIIIFFLGVDYSISIYFNCILLSIDIIHNAYICIQNSIGMFQVGVEHWFVLSIEAID